MKQSEYLRELKINLESKLPAAEINDILSDYESFFISGREEGKSDDEISDELGSPSLLAKSLLDEHSGKTNEASYKNTANPGRRLCAYLIDAVIAVLPAVLVTLLFFNGAMTGFLSGFLLVSYPSPLPGVFISSIMSVGGFDESVKVMDESGNVIQSYVIRDGVRYSEREMKSRIMVDRAFYTAAVIFYLFYSLISTLLMKGQTIGKRLMRIKVRNMNTGSITNGSIFYREFLGKVLINSIPLAVLISCLTILLTKEHRALHDMLADTIVLES